MQTWKPRGPRKGRGRFTICQGIHRHHRPRDSQALPPRDREVGGQDVLAQPPLPIVYLGLPRRVCPTQGDVGSSEASSDEPRYTLCFPRHVLDRGGCRKVPGGA